MEGTALHQAQRLSLISHKLTVNKVCLFTVFILTDIHWKPILFFFLFFFWSKSTN